MARARIAEIDNEATSPDSDRLDGFPHPRETHVLFGHREAERTLLQAARSGRMHHAWLLAGPEGIGKATLAYRLVRNLLLPLRLADTGVADLSAPADAPTVRQVAALSHPNLLVLRRPWQERNERFATAITVDEIRRLKSFLGRTPGAGQWRTVVVDRAEDMNLNAANALLKSLEEPPPQTIFLLIASAPGALPPTVRSRCRTLAMHRLDDADLKAAVTAAMAGREGNAPEGESLARAVALAGGSVRQALQLFADEGIALYGQLSALLASLPRLDYRRVHALADKVSARQSEVAFEMLFDLLEEAVARLVRHAATGAGAMGEEATLAERLMPRDGLARWAQLWEEVRRAKAEAVALNLDRKSLVLGTFFRLEEIARDSARISG